VTETNKPKAPVSCSDAAGSNPDPLPVSPEPQEGSRQKHQPVTDSSSSSRLTSNASNSLFSSPRVLTSLPTLAAAALPCSASLNKTKIF